MGRVFDNVAAMYEDILAPLSLFSVYEDKH